MEDSRTFFWWNVGFLTGIWSPSWLLCGSRLNWPLCSWPVLWGSLDHWLDVGLHPEPRRGSPSVEWRRWTWTSLQALGIHDPFWGHLLIPEMRLSPTQVEWRIAGVSQALGPAPPLLWGRLEPHCFSCPCVHPLPLTLFSGTRMFYILEIILQIWRQKLTQTHTQTRADRNFSFYVRTLQTTRPQWRCVHPK